MSIIIAIVVALFSPAEGLRRTAPLYLTEASASEHMLAAHIAGAVYDLEPELLLSVAWHESRYTITFTPEAGGLTSCGTMTPEPLAKCTSTSILDGYVAGARHLRTWLTACRGGMRCALIGYGGGFRLLETCRTDKQHRGCALPEVFLHRARWIRSNLKPRTLT